MHAPWPPDHCPAWCVADHSPDDHPDDRVHQSSSRRFGVVTLRTEFLDDGVARTATAAEYELVLFQPQLDPEPWIHVGAEDERGTDLSLESARRLAAALQSFDADLD